MKQRYHNYLLFTAGFALFILSACCEPGQKNSFPFVIDTSYTDTAVKDAIDIQIPIDPLDSGYYPIYSLDIKNTGAEADTFLLSYTRTRNGYAIPLYVKQYVQPGETKTFKTYGPIPSNSDDSAKVNFYSFYVHTIDSISLFVLQPEISIHYGRTPNGPEQCGSPGKDIAVDPLKLKHK